MGKHELVKRLAKAQEASSEEEGDAFTDSGDDDEEKPVPLPFPLGS